MATLNDFEEWLKDISRFGGSGYIDRYGDACTPNESRRKIKIYTDVNCYLITATERPNDTGYLGCISKSRKPRAGEDWHRGSDLADGPLHVTTWHRILGDIVSHEMVRIAERREPVVVLEGNAAGSLPESAQDRNPTTA